MPTAKYIEAAKAGATPVDLVRMTRRVSEDIYRHRSDWNMGTGSNIDLDRYADQATLAPDTVMSEGHENGGGNHWRHAVEINSRGQVTAAQSLLIVVPVKAAGLVDKVEIRCKNQQDSGDLLCTVIPGVDDPALSDPSVLSQMEQYTLSRPVQKAEGWLTFDFSSFGIIKEVGSAIGLLFQPGQVDGNHAGINLWESDNTVQADLDLHYGRGMQPEKWVAVTSAARVDQCLEFRLSTQGYVEQGSLSLDFDLGAIPGALDLGEWLLASWIEPGASLSATAYASASGLFTGEQTSLGSVQDGTAITNKKRYYRLTFSFNASSSRLCGCGLIEAGPRFTRTDTWARSLRPMWGHAPSVGEISINEGEVNASEGKSTAAKPYIKFTDPDLSRRLQEYDYQGEEIVILRGYDYPGFVETDCEVQARARIADYVQDERVELETIDLLRDLMDRELPPPAEDPETKTIVNVFSLHPVDAVELLLRRAGLRPSLIDSAALAAVKGIERWADIRLSRVLNEQQTLKTILDELLAPLLATVYERNGKIAVSRLDWSATPAATITEAQISRNSEKFSPRLREGRGYYVLVFGQKTSSSGKGYSALKGSLALESYNRFNGAGERVEYPWLPSSRDADAAVIVDDMTYVRKYGLPMIEATLDSSLAWLQPGMTVLYHSARYRRRGATNFNPLLCQVTQSVAEREGVDVTLVVLKDAQASAPGGIEPVTPPAGFTASEANGGARFELTASPDPRVKEYRVFEALAGSTAWRLAVTFLPVDFTAGKKIWTDTSYTRLGAFDRKAVAVASSTQQSEPVYALGFRVRAALLAAPEVTLTKVSGVYMIDLVSLPSGAVDLVIENRMYGKSWQRIERTVRQIIVGETITTWSPAADRYTGVKLKGGAVEYFRIAAVDRYGQTGAWTRELFVPTGTQLARDGTASGAVTFDPDNPPELVHQLHGTYFRHEVRLTLLLPLADVDRVQALEIWRRDNGGSGAVYGAWEQLDKKIIERDESTAPPVVVEYRDWRQIKAGWKYQYQVRMIDLAGLAGAWSAVQTVEVTEDTTAPDKPSILSVTPLNLKNLITLSEPVVGGVPDKTFAHAQVQAFLEGGSAWEDVDAQTVRRAVEHQLSPAYLGSRYKYRARYKDTSGNWSPWSDETGWNLVLKIGVTELDDSVNSLLTQVTTNAGNISTHATLISQNAQAIALRAYASDLNTLTGRVSSAEASLIVQAGEIAARAYSSTVSAIDGRLSTAEGTLSVLPGQISAKVSKDGVIAAINLTEEEALIQAAKIGLQGETITIGDPEGFFMTFDSTTGELLMAGTYNSSAGSSLNVSEAILIGPVGADYHHEIQVHSYPDNVCGRLGGRGVLNSAGSAGLWLRCDSRTGSGGYAAAEVDVFPWLTTWKYNGVTVLSISNKSQSERLADFISMPIKAEVGINITGEYGFVGGNGYLQVNGDKVLNARLNGVTKPSGGSVIDVQARAAIDKIIDRLRVNGWDGHGLIADSET